MRTIHLADAMGNREAVLDGSLQETLHLLSTEANAVRLQVAIAEADGSLPAGARILEPARSRSPDPEPPG